MSTSASWRAAARSPAADRGHVQPDLALDDHAAPVLQHDLDRIFDGDDAAAGGRSRGRRSAPPAWWSCPRPGAAATSDQARPRARASSRTSAGRPRRVERRRLGRDQAQATWPSPPRCWTTCTRCRIAGRGRQRHGRRRPVRSRISRRRSFEQRHRQAVKEVARQPGGASLQRAQLAVDAQDRRQSRLQVDVRGAQLTRRRQRPIEEGVHRHGSSMPCSMTSAPRIDLPTRETG